MIFYGNMSGLSRRAGGGLRGLGAFGAAGLSLGIGAAAAFTKGDVYRDFTNGKGQSGGCEGRDGKGVFQGPSASVIGNAAKRYGDLQAAADMGNMDAQATLDQWDANIRSAIKRAESMFEWDTDGIFKCGRSDNREVLYTNALKDVKTLVSHMSNQGVPAQAVGAGATTIPTQQGALTTVLTGNVGTPGAGVDQLTALISGLSSRLVSTSTQNQGGAVADTAGPSWVLPAAIGGGVLVFTGLVFALARKKKAPAPAMAGYRRRRRH